jgi:O-antigen/teichoic acid export membrane protein
MKNKLKFDVAISYVTQIFTRLIAFASTVIFARILTPDEIGIFVIASGIIYILGEVKILGVGNYLVRKSNLSEYDIKLGLLVTIFMCWSLGGGIYLASGQISQFYDISELEKLLEILSFTFLLAPHVSIASAILQRAMRFTEILYIRVGAVLSGFILSLFLVLDGYSYYGLAYALVGASIVEILLSWFLTRKEFVFFPVFGRVFPILKFGIFSSVSLLFAKMETVLPDLVIGKVWSAREVGIFSRSSGFVLFISEAITMGARPVSVPYLSEIHRTKGNVTESFLRGTELLSLISWPILAVVGISSYPIILLLFGDQWVEAARYAQILVIWGIFRESFSLFRPLMISTHNESFLLLKQFITLSILMIALLLSYQESLLTIALAVAASGILDFLITIFFLKKKFNLAVKNALYCFRKPLLMTLICSSVATVISYVVNFHESSALFSVLMISFILPFAWMISLYFIEHELFQTTIGKLLKQ